MIRWHRWIALAFALFLCVQVLTGLLLVFRGEITALGLPPAVGTGQGAVSHATRAEPYWDGRTTGYGAGEAGRSLADIRRAAAALWPRSILLQIQFPNAWTRDYIVRVQDAGVRHLVAVDPTDLSVTRVGMPGHLLMSVLELHEELFVGTPGHVMTALNGVALSTLVLTGWYLWWPRRSRLKGALKFPLRGAARTRLFYWHRSLGALTGLILLPVAVMGVVLALGPFLPDPSETREAPSTRADGDDARLQLARSLFPELAVRDVRFDRSSGRLVRVVLCPPGAGLRAPITDVRFEVGSGKLEAIIEGRKLTGYQRVAAWGLPIHTAQFGGLGARVLLFVAGLATLALGVLGICLWSVRREAAG